jgi:pimeloyl-ACP methyl ester carboxylesterase
MRRLILRAVPVLLAFPAFACQQEPATTTTEEPMTIVTSGDGTRIAFDKTGSGPALIIVSGALSHRKLYGDTALQRLLAQHFTTYTYDRRGRGESADVQPYAVEREIEDIEALINDAGGQAYLYGISSGAALALRAAAALGPTKVTKLALYEPPYGQDTKEFGQQKEQINEIIKSGKPGEAAEFFLSALGTPPDALEGMKASPEWHEIRKIDRTLAYDFEVMGTGTVPADIARTIAVPTLVMDGEKSMDFMHATADQLAKLVPGAQRKTLTGQTHQAAADVVAPTLIAFLRG